MSTNNQTNTELESVENQYWVDQAKALERLEANEDFKTLILEGYFKEFVINQTSMLATEAVRREGTRAVIMEQLVAVSRLEDHFGMIRVLGGLAEADIDEANFPDED